MGNSASFISLARLSLIAIPVVVVMMIFLRWRLKTASLVYAVIRMLSQLLLIGYVLIVIFGGSSSWVTLGVLMVMMLSSAWIALRPIAHLRLKCYGRVLLALLIGGVPILALVVGGVIQLDPWYSPRYIIPLAGMIFANGMNSVSLSAERLWSEMKQGKAYEEARATAFQTGLLPLTNSFFAVGLVSIPGMMTGQILAGTSPLLAARYQIMVMCMLLGSCGISSALFLWMMKDIKLDVI